MMTLLSTLLGFASGGLPKLLEFFQSKSDNKQELALAKLQNDRDMAMAERGFVAQQRVEEIRTEQVSMQSQAQTHSALLQHDVEIGKGASRWVVNMRAMVRPTITYGLFFLLVAVDIAGFAYGWQKGTDFTLLLDTIWDAETQQIWATVIAFWFGSQAFKK